MTTALLPRQPKSFRPAGEVLWARLVEAPPLFSKEPKRSGAQMRGIRYEKRMHWLMEQRFGEHYVPGAWFEFETKKVGKRWCQADALLVFPEQSQIVLIEYKYSHCALAWWQLFQLYLPVVQRVFGPRWKYSCCEVVKWFDPMTKGPRPVHMVSDIMGVPEALWGVHICKPH